MPKRTPRRVEEQCLFGRSPDSLRRPGLVVGLFGSSVSAQFANSVTAQENIQVGTFSCGNHRRDHGRDLGAIDALGYAHTVSYTAPTIMSSAAGSAPFSFTVQNTGSIADVLTVSTSPVGSPFSIIGAPFAAIPLAAAASHTYNTGVAWGELTNANLGTSGTVTWTVDCGESQTVTSADLQYGPTGWGGWSCPAGTQVVSAAVQGGTYASLTLWRPGASVPGYSYPTTPFGYTYNALATPPEEGADTNDNIGKTLVIVLQCTLP